jgi:Tfp pilus assembly protein PilF
MHLQSRRLAPAARALDRAVTLWPEYAGALFLRGFVCAALGDVDKAADSYRRLTALQPQNGRAHCELGNVLLRAGRCAEAREAFARARAAGFALPPAARVLLDGPE